MSDIRGRIAGSARGRKNFRLNTVSRRLFPIKTFEAKLCAGMSLKSEGRRRRGSFSRETDEARLSPNLRDPSECSPSFSRIENFGFKSLPCQFANEPRALPQTLFSSTPTYPLRIH